MKGIFLPLFAAIALFLWSWDMVYPWQKLMQAEENRYSQIQQTKKLKVGMINHPLSYFVSAEGNSGIEYELSKAFADYLAVELDVTLFDNSEQLFQALRDNKIDMAAAGLLYQSERNDRHQIGASYYSASWQVAYKKGTQRPYKLDELKSDIIVPSGSPVISILEQLRENQPLLKWQTTDAFTQEELLLQVAEGKIPYTVAPSVDISSAQYINPNLAVGFDLTDEMPVVWYFAKSSFSELQASVLDFMDKANETGLIARIEEKYFNHLNRFDYADASIYLNAVKNILPKYRALFEKHKGELEWQMLAAIAYQESRWDPTATSPTGVRGIMMLTRDTAERMKVADRTNAEQSIRGGAEYLNMLLRQIPETVPAEDRIWYGLAAYNMGLGHLLDVRRLTKQLGGDPDNWLDVKKNLPLLAEKRHYANLKYGYARGFEAFNYVENIRKYHSSLVNHLRVEEQKLQQEQKELEKQTEENVNQEKTNET
nr:membrane-bound lytic murein transglycosylase MltF [uncultured Haemophilus sp.]